MFRFSDHSETRKSLLEAGFAEPEVRDLAYIWEISTPDRLFECFNEGAVRAGALLRSQNPEALEAIKTSVRNDLTSYEREGIIGVPMGAVLASAIKPT